MKFNSIVSTAIKPAILLGLLVFYVYIIGSHLINNSLSEGMQEGATNKPNKANDLASKSNDLASKSNALASKANDLASKANDLASKSNDLDLALALALA